MSIIATLSRDVFFGMRIRTVLQQLGYELVLCNSEHALLKQYGNADLVIVDFNQPVDWAALTDVTASQSPVIAFGSHTNVEGFRLAREAGVDRTISNGEFSRKLPELLGKFTATPSQDSDQDDASDM
ncbi:MAG: response regulator [Thermomicrobiales bacterium]|nr:response regulator [Thermomicrobiales bacterium]MCO5217219.1 response regulator [Thermomicrobiales bacterium]MCO5225300.1 response regulator [Thermomicrobiales bacterium]MCO5227833.1 response regulator [Thermomicrobiales bacterium]